MNFKMLVCGGRDFTDKNFLVETLDKLVWDMGLVSEPDEYGNWLPSNLTIIHGAAKGADSLADDWAVSNWVPVAAFEANWDKHGKAAGPIRNQRMLDEGRPDLVVAFPGGRGTQHMINIARKAGVEILEVKK